MENVYAARLRRLQAKRRELIRVFNYYNRVRGLPPAVEYVEVEGEAEVEGFDDEAREGGFDEDGSEHLVDRLEEMEQDFEEELEEDQEYARDNQGWGWDQPSPLARDAEPIRYRQEPELERLRRRNLADALVAAGDAARLARQARVDEVLGVLRNLHLVEAGQRMRLEAMARRFRMDGGGVYANGMMSPVLAGRQLEMLAEAMVAAEERGRQMGQAGGHIW